MLEINKLELRDDHFVSAFDIKDKSYIDKHFTNRIKSMNQSIRELMQHRFQIKVKYYETKDKGFLVNLAYTDLEINKVRTQQINLMKKFYEYLQRDWNDQTLGTLPKPIQNIFQRDVYVAEGIDIIGAQITSKTTVSWEWIQIGKGTRPAEIGDQALQLPLGSFPIDEGGSFSSIGDQIRLFCVLPDTIEDSIISEYAVTELDEGGKMLSRTTLVKPVKHTLAKDFPTITNVTYLIPHQDI